MMERQHKIGIIVATIFFSAIFCDGLYSYFLLKRQFKECVAFTIVKVKRVYKSRQITRVEYGYTVNSQNFEHTGSIGLFDESKDRIWGPNFQELSNKKRLLIKFYCKDASKHIVLWDAKVPDTLQFIPPNGWKEIPYGLGTK